MLSKPCWLGSGAFSVVTMEDRVIPKIPAGKGAFFKIRTPEEQNELEDINNVIKINCGHLDSFVNQLEQIDIKELPFDTRRQMGRTLMRVCSLFEDARFDFDKAGGSNVDSPASEINTGKYHKKKLLSSDELSCRHDESDEYIKDFGGRKKNLRNIKQVNSNFDESLLKLLADKLDNKKSPIQRKFNDNSGESLKDYLDQFEEYCSDNLRGGSKFWIDELEERLSGETLKAFKSVKSNRDNYDDVKKKLLAWYNEMKESRRRRAKHEFEKMQYDPNESLYLYSNRLLKVFKRAFPSANVEKSSTLRDKYINSIPKSAKSQLNVISFVNNKSMTWSSIQEFATRRDARVYRTSSSDSSDGSVEPKEILINANTTVNKKHADKVKVKYDKTSKTFFIENDELARLKPPDVQFSSDKHQNQQMSNSRKSVGKSFSSYNQQPRFDNHENVKFKNQPKSESRYATEYNNSYGNSKISLPPSDANFKSCYRCGRSGHFASHCFATSCLDCKRSGHTEKECWAKNSRSNKGKPQQSWPRNRYSHTDNTFDRTSSRQWNSSN